MTRLALLLALFLLAWSSSNPVAAEPFPADVTDNWTLRAQVVDDELHATVEREIVLHSSDGQSLMSDALPAPNKAAQLLSDSGAATATCRLESQPASVTLSCRARYRWAIDRERMPLPLPDDRLLASVLALTHQFGISLTYTQHGEISSTLPLADLPRSRMVPVGGAMAERHIRQLADDAVRVTLSVAWPAGAVPDLGAALPSPAVWVRYTPPLTVWWLWLLALITALASVRALFPVRKYRDDRRPQDADRMTTGARFALYVLTAGLGLAGLGLVVTAWVAAALVDWAVVWRDRGLMVLNEWPWPILWPSSEMINTAAGLALAIGVTCLVLATGLARRREWARRATVTMLLALFLLWLAHWPAWLLLPPRLPGHTMTTWLVGILLLLLHTFAMGALNHPAICRQFLPEGAATQ